MHTVHQYLFLNMLQAAACQPCDYTTLDENESKQWKTYSRCASSYNLRLVGCSDEGLCAKVR